MLIVCKKCNTEQDARDVNNGICIWCEQKEASENSIYQSFQSASYSFNKRAVDKQHRVRCTHGR